MTLISTLFRVHFFGMLIATSIVVLTPWVRAATPALAAAAKRPGPVAAQKPFVVESPHGNRTDPYYWLRDDTRKQPAVLAHLKAENVHYEAYAKSYAKLTDKLFNEIVGRIAKDDSSVPYKKGNYLYYTRFIKGGEYPIFARKPFPGGREQILLDSNREARGKSYFEVPLLAVSANEQTLAYLEDDNGRRQYTLRFRDLKTGKNLPDVVKGLSNTMAWANDNKTIYYVENDPVTLLSTRVKKHVLGSDTAKDPVVYEEADNTYFLSIDKTGDDRFIKLISQSTETSEMRIIDADQAQPQVQVFAPRTRNIKYGADHIAGRWVIRTDWDAPNYRLMTVEDADVGERSRWKELVAHADSVFIEGMELFNDYLVINGRSDGLLSLRVIPWATPHKATVIKSDEPAYVAILSTNAEQNTKHLRYTYTSLTTPRSEY